MVISVRLFAMLKEKVGRDIIELELSRDSKVSDLIEEIKRAYPEISDLLRICRTVVNREYAPLKTLLNDGDEVALIPPVSGGNLCF